jgi:hypothetical protein
VKTGIFFFYGGLLDIENHSFIVRVWNDSIGDGKSVWRGSIEKVGSDEKLYFSHLEGVVRFIQDQIEFKPQGSPKIWNSLVLWIKDAIGKH